MKILFVCSSNVCRSPYAEFVFRRLVKSSPVLSAAGVEVSSSAVFNRSKVIFPKAAVSLKREGFSEKEIAAFKPSFKCSAKEKFRDADVIIYNGTIDDGVTSLKELVEKNALLADFRAVRNGNVWTCDSTMYQQMTSMADIIYDLRAAIGGSDEPTTFVWRLE